MQEGKGIFINNTLNKNYPIGEKQTGWTRQGWTRQDKTRLDKTRQGKARQGKARQGKARQGKARQDTRHKLHTITNQHGTANTGRF